MKAGRLTEVIEIQRATSTVNDAGTPEQTWAALATLRAERVDPSTAETIEGYGASDTATVTLRARFLDGVTNADRVIWKGAPWNITRVAPIGRRKGIELYCKRIEP